MSPEGIQFNGNTSAWLLRGWLTQSYIGDALKGADTFGAPMNSGMTTALAAVCGSLVGALGSAVGTWITQRHEDRRDLLGKQIARREALYSDFIAESARLLVDAMEHNQERLGGRLALISEVNIAGKIIVTYNLHLESRGDDQLRCSQLDEALDDAIRYNTGRPILLTGDFNLDVSNGPAATAISRAQFQDAFANHHVATTPSSFLEHGRAIDWIFARGPVRGYQPQVHRSVSASDHYPLSIDLAIV